MPSKISVGVGPMVAYTITIKLGTYLVFLANEDQGWHQALGVLHSEVMVFLKVHF